MHLLPTPCALLGLRLCLTLTYKLERTGLRVLKNPIRGACAFAPLLGQDVLTTDRLFQLSLARSRIQWRNLSTNPRETHLAIDRRRYRTRRNPRLCPTIRSSTLGGLTKPATVLIEKISDAVGTLWEPKQIRRVAQAKADAALTLAKGDIEIDEVQRRAAQRFVDEETKKQLNMESIVGMAIQGLDENAPTEDIEGDWITNFFDKCRSVSDHEMQLLWSRILSGEANAPGSFSRKTVNLVADLDKASAKLFHTLCSFGWQFANMLNPLIFDFSDRIYNQRGIILFSLGELDSIGLIQIDATRGFALNGVLFCSLT